MFLCLYYIQMAKKVVETVKKVVKKVAPKKTVAKKVVAKVEDKFVVEVPNTVELVDYQLSKIVGNNVMKIEVPAIAQEVGKYDKELLWTHLDKISGANVSKQELKAIFASLFR